MSGVSLPLGAYDLTLGADLVKAITQLPPGWQAVLRECHWVAINCCPLDGIGDGIVIFPPKS
jgi:hypothetical protein